MPIEVRLLEDHGIVEKVYRGPVTKAEILAGAECSAAIAHAAGKALILSDCRELESVHAESDFYDVKDFIDRRDFNKLTYREALIPPTRPWAMAGVDAWLKVACGHGLVVRVFDDRDRAITWLKN